LKKDDGSIEFVDFEFGGISERLISFSYFFLLSSHEKILRYCESFCGMGWTRM
jgi:hypothetical protein